MKTIIFSSFIIGAQFVSGAGYAHQPKASPYGPYFRLVYSEQDELCKTIGTLYNKHIKGTAEYHYNVDSSNLIEEKYADQFEKAGLKTPPIIPDTELPPGYSSSIRKAERHYYYVDIFNNGDVRPVFIEDWKYSRDRLMNTKILVMKKDADLQNAWFPIYLDADTKYISELRKILDFQIEYSESNTYEIQGIKILSNEKYVSKKVKNTVFSNKIPIFIGSNGIIERIYNASNINLLVIRNFTFFNILVIKVSSDYVAQDICQFIDNTSRGRK